MTTLSRHIEVLDVDMGISDLGGLFVIRSQGRRVSEKVFIKSSPIKSIQWARPTGDSVASRGDLQITSDKELALEGSNLHRFASGWYRCDRMIEEHLMV